MKKKLIALNLMLLLIFELLPVPVFAASTALTVGSTVTTSNISQAGYTFTPKSTGLYTFKLDATKKGSSEVSCGSLQLYGDGVGWTRNAIDSIYANTYTCTLALKKGITYSVKGMPIDSAADKYTLSVNTVVLATLTSSLSFTTTKEAKYFKFTPNASGWYKFTSSYGDIGVYDENLSGVFSRYTTDNGSLAELKSGSTYYLTYNRYDEQVNSDVICVVKTDGDTESGSDIVASGTCGARGNNLRWTLDSDGLLIIGGSGNMEDGYQSWYDQSDYIKNVKINNGVRSIGASAFRNCSGLTSITIPESVTSIGEDAFNSCSGLTSITIPNSVKSIGDSAFFGCTNLPKVTIPDSVTDIGVRVFASCSSLTTITIPNSVTSLGKQAISWCLDLTSISIPDSVTSLGEECFSGCISLTSINIPKGVTNIGDRAFFGCDSLTTVALSDSVTSIGEKTFLGCDSLTNITIPNSVTSIGEGAFSDCSSLTSIEIPNSVTSIGDWAFWDCSSLATITISDSLTSIGEKAFYGCRNLTKAYISDMDAWCGLSFGDATANPLYYAKNIYLNGEKVVSVEVPEGVTSLDYTFYGFKDLVRVILPNSLMSIGENTFSGCRSLTSITIPDSVTNIGDRAFYGCRSLTTATLSKSLMSIGAEIFAGCSSLKSISIPDGVMSIGESTFSGCSSLASITIPDSVTSIGGSAFSGCSSLASITIPDSVTSIGGSAFSGCSNLTSITIPDNVTSIGNSAFSNCISLTSITIPERVTSIGDEAFYFCRGLTNITISDGVKDIGRCAFLCCDNLTNVYISDMDAWCKISFDDAAANPLSHANNLYLNGTKVETLEISEGIQAISSNAFINATCIERVALPKSLIGIAIKAFSGCTGIKEVYYAGSEKDWNELAISTGNECIQNAQIYYGSTIDEYYCRIRVKVSDGGRISVDRSTAQKEDVITVTATPYAGYELSGISVDGEKIDGNTFIVTGNHEVSAAFTQLPNYGGTEDYRLEGITVYTDEGEKLQELTRSKLLVSVSVRNMSENSGATIMLAQYDAAGRYQGVAWLTIDEATDGTAMKFTLPLDNRDGKIVNLKAFVVNSIFSPFPIGNAVSFGEV